jgi:hypothetical protein
MGKRSSQSFECHRASSARDLFSLKDKNADEIRIDLCTLSPNVGAPHHVPQVADFRGFVGDADLVIVTKAAFPEDSAGFVPEEFVDKEAAVEKT